MLVSISIGKHYVSQQGRCVRVLGFVKHQNTKQGMVVYEWPDQEMCCLSLISFCAMFYEKSSDS